MTEVEKYFPSLPCQRHGIDESYYGNLKSIRVNIYNSFGL